MKTTRTHALLMGLFATLVIISCRKSNLVGAGEDTTGKSNIVLVTNNIPIELADCGTTCINPEGPFIETSGSKTQTWGNANNPHWKTVSHVVYNTSTSFVVKVTFTHSGGNTSNTVSVTAFGCTKSVATLASGSTATFTFDLPAGWNACDNVPFSIYQEGLNSPMNIPCSYSLYAVCPNRCATAFTGQAIACGEQREAVYTFTSAEALEYIKIQGGLTNFTGENAEVIVTDATGMTTSQWTTGGSSNRVIRVVGGIDACETITIRIRWNSTNSGGVITGSWSVKDGNGVDVATVVEGLTCGN